MEDKRIVGIVNIEDSIGARRDMKHKHAIHAVKKVMEAWVTTSWMEAERIVNRDVATVGAACACHNRNSVIAVPGNHQFGGDDKREGEKK